MSTLLRPIPDSPHGSQGNITQPFLGTDSWEHTGWVRLSGTPDIGRRGAFPRSVQRDHVHLAIDYSAAIGTAVSACATGPIIDQGNDPYSGNARFVIQRIHRNDTFAFYLAYYHLAPGTFRFKIGQIAMRGDVIAASGNSGWSKAPHLHLEAFRLPLAASAKNPDWYLAATRWDPQPFIDGSLALDDIG